MFEAYVNKFYNEQPLTEESHECGKGCRCRRCPACTPGTREFEGHSLANHECGKGCRCRRCPACTPGTREFEGHSLAKKEEDCKGVWNGYGKFGSIQAEDDEAYHGAAKTHKDANPEATHEAIVDHLKKIYGDKFDPEKAHRAAAKATGKVDSEDTEVELGHDPEELKEYEQAEDDRLKYFESVFEKIKNGTISVDEFKEWCADQDVMPLKGEGEEVHEKVKGVTKKQQALAGAVCNKRIGKHKGNPSKLRELAKCMKGVEKSEVKYGYKPKKNK